MKKISILILIITLTLSCKKERNTDYIIISGKLENPTTDSLFIKNSNDNFTILLDKSKTFSDTLKLTKGYYYIENGENSSQIFLSTNYNLDIKIFDIKDSILFKGIGANENNYLVKKNKLKKTFGKLNDYTYYNTLNEKNFLKLTDSLHQVLLESLNNSKGLSTDFLALETNKLKLDKLNKLAEYELLRKILTQDFTFKVSENFPNPYQGIDMNNEKLLAIPEFVDYIKNYYTKKHKNAFSKKDSLDFQVSFLNSINTDLKNQKIKNNVLFEISRLSIKMTKDLDGFYNKFMESVSNENYKNKITQIYKSLKKTAKGATSPTFELFDINNNLVSLNDFKGKVVYIDIWATWCAPCLIEIPKLKELEIELNGRNIEFVSICKNDTKENWERMLKDKNLTGIQLFAPDENISFFKDYSVTGIPRFILIDKEGKIIDSNANSPSHPNLKEELLKLL